MIASSAVFLTAGSPALAQETAQETTAPAENELIGNPQLRDFSLNGTVTRRAETPAQVEQPQSTSRSTAEQGSRTATARPAQPSRDSSAAAARAESTARGEPTRSATASGAADLPPPTPTRRTETSSVSASDDSAVLPSQPAVVAASADPNLAPSRNEIPLFPWLIAALALAGAAAWYFLRQRPRESFAGAGALNAFDAPSLAPPVRTPPPAAPKQPSGGIVSTRLRPWLEIEFTPQRAVVDEQKAAVAFELSVYNSGSVPARDVLLEASLFNAGPMQDQQIRMFFENPVAKGDRIPVIPPLKKIKVDTAVFLPRDQVRPIEVEGRTLFVPMIAFNALYGWGGGEGQSSVSYLVGKTTKGEKLAPFRLDLGPRVFRGLAAREHELRLRK
ncbi:MAG: hypothetical protein ACR2JJ_09395 [Sphingomicrobium sp.]